MKTQTRNIIGARQQKAISRAAKENNLNLSDSDPKKRYENRERAWTLAAQKDPALFDQTTIERMDEGKIDSSKTAMQCPNCAEVPRHVREAIALYPFCDNCGEHISLDDAGTGNPLLGSDPHRPTFRNGRKYPDPDGMEV